MVKTYFYEAVGKEDSKAHILETDYSEFEDYREICGLGAQEIEAVVTFFGHDKYSKKGVTESPQDIFLYGCFKLKGSDTVFRCSSLAILSHLCDCIEFKHPRFRLCRMSTRYGVSYYVKECAENV